MQTLDLSNHILIHTLGIPASTVEEAGDEIREIIQNIARFKAGFYNAISFEVSVGQDNEDLQEQIGSHFTEKKEEQLHFAEKHKKTLQQTYGLSDQHIHAIEQYIAGSIEHVVSLNRFISRSEWMNDIQEGQFLIYDDLNMYTNDGDTFANSTLQKLYIFLEKAPNIINTAADEIVHLVQSQVAKGRTLEELEAITRKAPSAPVTITPGTQLELQLIRGQFVEDLQTVEHPREKEIVEDFINHLSELLDTYYALSQL